MALTEPVSNLALIDLANTNSVVITKENVFRLVCKSIPGIRQLSYYRVVQVADYSASQ